mmetsp:Transcript_20424/g.36623  ORF Transcript_20424/g.36623 Transcript_20424/m.36623 type:complete len:208 (-) Transcript_20424:2475-3098(-)
MLRSHLFHGLELYLSTIEAKPLPMQENLPEAIAIKLAEPQFEQQPLQLGLMLSVFLRLHESGELKEGPEVDFRAICSGYVWQPHFTDLLPSEFDGTHQLLALVPCLRAPVELLQQRQKLWGINFTALVRIEALEHLLKVKHLFRRIVRSLARTHQGSLATLIIQDYEGLEVDVVQALQPLLIANEAKQCQGRRNMFVWQAGQFSVFF